MILDCTLRDGGYYTNWTFETKMVNLIHSLDLSGVDVVELGYKSPKKVENTESVTTDLYGKFWSIDFL